MFDLTPLIRDFVLFFNLYAYRNLYVQPQSLFYE